MKIQSLIYGVAAVLFTINTASAMSCAQISCPTGYNKVRVYGNECECQKGMTPSNDNVSLVRNDDNFVSTAYTTDPVVPNEPQETCETKEVNGDITSCCHTASGSPNIIDFVNTRATDKLENLEINTQNVNAVEVRSLNK